MKVDLEELVKVYPQEVGALLAAMKLDRSLANLRATMERLREGVDGAHLALTKTTVSIPEAAERLGVSQREVRRRLKCRLLSSFVLDRRTVIPVSELERFESWNRRVPTRREGRRAASSSK